MTNNSWPPSYVYALIAGVILAGVDVDRHRSRLSRHSSCLRLPRSLLDLVGTALFRFLPLLRPAGQKTLRGEADGIVHSFGSRWSLGGLALMVWLRGPD